ncbi:MAG: hypothetical protein ABFQ95_07045 [Pseudomonadota bacterium]
MRDLIDNIKVKPLITPTQIEGEFETAPLCIWGYDSLTLILNLGKEFKGLSDENCVQFLLEHGDSKETLTPVVEDHILGGDPITDGVIMTLNDDTQVGSVYCFGYLGDRSLVQLKVLMRGTHEVGIPMSCVAVLGHGEYMPPESYMERLDAIEEAL